MNARQRLLEEKLNGMGLVHSYKEGMLWIDADVVAVEASEDGLEIIVPEKTEKYSALWCWNRAILQEPAHIQEFVLVAARVF